MPPSKKRPLTISLEDHLCFQLYTTSLKLTQIYKPLLAELRITYPQYLVMVVLWEQDGLGIKDLARRMQQDSGSITPLAKRLEAEGYLTRARDPRDERNVLLTLTPAGRELRTRGATVNREFSRTCALMQDELDTLMAGIDTLNKRLAA